MAKNSRKKKKRVRRRSAQSQKPINDKKKNTIYVAIAAGAAIVGVFLIVVLSAPPDDAGAPGVDPGFNGVLPPIGPFLSSDEWQTEAFSEEASNRLESLVDAIFQRAGAEQIAKHLEREFAGQPLRPSTLATAYDVDGLVVRRSANSTAHDDKALMLDRDAWINSLAIFAKSIGRGEKLYSNVQVDQVRREADSIWTDVRFEAAAGTEAQKVQVQASWRCRWGEERPGEEPRLLGIEVRDYEEVIRDRPQAVHFVDCTQSVLGANSSFERQFVPGLDHWLDSTREIFDRLRWGDHGFALGDVNGDGRDDIYVCEPGLLPNRLFVHSADGTAREVSADAGIDWLDQSRSALFVDLDNDGDQDVIIGTSRAVLVMSNDGAAHFALRSELREIRDAYALSAADYDNDGLLDIFACVNFERPYRTDELPLAIPYHDATNGGRNVLLKNHGDFRFADVTAKCGLENDNNRWSVAASWEDYDNDGDQDVYVANMFGPNCLYQNNEGHFKNVAAAAGVEDVGLGMSVVWGDYNQDGFPDLHVSNVFSDTGHRITHHEKFKANAPDAVRALYQRMASGSSLFENGGDGRFRDVSSTMAAARARWACGAAFIDVNNDSRDDLVVANGFLTRTDRGDLESHYWQQFVSRSPLDASDHQATEDYRRAWQTLVDMIREGRSLGGRQSNCCFLNLGGDQFADVSSVIGLDHFDDTRAVGAVDWDFDGDMDLWTINRTSPRIRFMRNDSANERHFLGVQLRGTTSNRDAIGSRVEVHLAPDSGEVLSKTLRAGGGFLTQSTKQLQFGLGDTVDVDRLILRWPNGESERFTKLRADTIYQITQGSGDPKPVALVAPPPLAPSPPTPIESSERLRWTAVGKVPMPSLRYKTWGIESVDINFPRKSPLLITMWAFWSTPCLPELREFASRHEELSKSGLDVLALTVDGAQDVKSVAVETARSFLNDIKFSFNSGLATHDDLEKLALLQQQLLPATSGSLLPTSFLVTPEGSLAAIYRGRTNLDVLLEDVRKVSATDHSAADLGSPFPGRWNDQPHGQEQLVRIAAAFGRAGHLQDSLRFAEAALAINPNSEFAKRNHEVARSNLSTLRRQVDEFLRQLRDDPNDAVAHYNLGLIRRSQGLVDDAVSHYRRAVEIDSEFLLAHINLGSLLAREGELPAAATHIERALQLDPGNEVAKRNLKLIERARQNPLFGQ